MILLLFTIFLIVPGIILIVLAERGRTHAKPNFIRTQNVIFPDSAPQVFPQVDQMLEISSPLEPSTDSSVIGENEGFKANITDFFEVKCEHIDPDENIPSPSGATISYLDASTLNFWDGRASDFQIPDYYKNTAFGRNVGPALNRLLSKGYLQRGNISKSISQKTVPELKIILNEKGLKVSGKKAELIQRLIENIPQNELEELFPIGVYQITETGKLAQEPYSLIFENNKYGLGLGAYRLIQAKEQNVTASDEKIILMLLNEDMQEALKTENIREYRNAVYKIARYLNSMGELHFSLQCFCLEFFLWVLSEGDYLRENGILGVREMTQAIEDKSLELGLSLDDLLDFFENTVRNANPFHLATQQNLAIALGQLKDGLGDSRKF